MLDDGRGRRTHARAAVHRTVLVVDVEEYGQAWRTTPHRLALREGLDRALRRAFDDTGVALADCRVEDCGTRTWSCAAPCYHPARPRSPDKNHSTQQRMEVAFGESNERSFAPMATDQRRNCASCGAGWSRHRIALHFLARTTREG